MTATEVRDFVKGKFQIPSANTDFDGDIDDCVEVSVSTLEPFVRRNYPADTSVTVASSSDSFTVPESGTTVYKLQVRASGTTDNWLTVKDFFQIGDEVYLQDEYGTAIDCRIFAQGEYDLSTIDNIPSRFDGALIDYACAEFASVLAGQKTKYNIYQQVNGARSVDSMADLAQFYEARAERRAEKVQDLEGSL